MRIISRDRTTDIPYEDSVLSIIQDKVFSMDTGEIVSKMTDRFLLYAYLIQDRFLLGEFSSRDNAAKEFEHIRTAYDKGAKIYSVRVDKGM